MDGNEDRPIACTLQPEELAQRLAAIRRMTAESLLRHRLEGRTLRLFYRADARPELERIVELERACCGFLEFATVDCVNEIELTITSPAQMEDDARWLFEHFLPEGSAPATPDRAACGCRVGACG